MEESRKQEIMKQVAEAMWEDKSDLCKKFMEEINTTIMEQSKIYLDESDAEDDEIEEIESVIIANFTEFMRRGINRGIKRTTKEFGRE